MACNRSRVQVPPAPLFYPHTDSPLVFASNMDKDKTQAYLSIIRNIGQVLSLAKLYNRQHPIVKTRINEVFQELRESILKKEKLTLAEVGGSLLINAGEIKAQDILMKSFANSLHDLGLGSLDLETGLNLDEFNVFIDLLNNTQRLRGEGEIRQYLKEKDATHLVPSFSTYKLVKKDEVIVKEEGILRAEKLPSEVIERFSQDLNKGEINKLLRREDKIYEVLAHDPVLLSKVVCDLTKDKDNTEELAKILWLIGDYLIDEISTTKQEVINRKVLNEVKEHLLSLLEQKSDNTRWKEETRKAFTTINAALQLKGLILLYKKHKKELERVTDKLREIFKSLPPQSQLYRKVKENLEKIGPPSLDIALFKTDTPP